MESHRQMLDLVGPRVFNKFVRALANAADRGSLFYWQEQLVQKARSAGIALPSSLRELAAVFPESCVVQVPISREEFLAEPMKYWLDPDVQVLPEWREAAAAQPIVRENLYYALARSVSKTGTFDLAQECLELLTRTLSTEEAGELYGYVRDVSGRLEYEWRPDFERAFPAAALDLPRTDDST